MALLTLIPLSPTYVAAPPVPDSLSPHIFILVNVALFEFDKSEFKSFITLIHPIWIAFPLTHTGFLTNNSFLKADVASNKLS